MSTAIILIALGFLLWSGPTQAHARLDHASPAAGSTLSSSPSEIALYFTEELEPKFSGAERAVRREHASITVVSISGKVMHLSVGILAPGNYTVKWHVTSVDTHKTQGSFSFTVGK